MNNEIEKLTASEIDFVFVETTNRGPFVEDRFYRIYGVKRSWRLPASQVSMDWVKSLPSIDLESLTLSQFSTDNAFFLIWTKHPELIVTTSRKTELLARLDGFFRRHFSMETKQSESLSKSIIETYDDGARAYHSLTHINQCLYELDTSTDGYVDKEKIELAIWYHDLVYVPASKKNEENSARRLHQDLGTFKSDISLPAVELMILASKHESDVRGDARDDLRGDVDTNLFLDIDLSVLGACRFLYETYANDVREEYKMIPSVVFYAGRKRLLKKLMRGRIFRISQMQEKYEANAKANIASELNQWRYRLLPI